ncbi:MAG: hypothetical protein AAFP77_18475 [Bacteroidota bacterium]
MKKTFLSLLICASFLTTQAQSILGQQWQLKRVGLHIGQDQDMLSVMDYDYFLGSLRTAPGFDFSNIGATEQHTYSMLCENPHLRLNASFQHANLRQVELGLSLVGIFNRIDEVVYATPGSDPWSADRQELSFTQYGSEIAIEPTLSYRLQNGAWALTGVLGGNAGYHFGNYLNVNGYNLTICENTVSFREGVDEPDCETLDYLYESGDQRNGFSGRMFAEVQASFTIARRFEMGLMMRRGLGFRTVNGGPTVGTNLHSGGVFMKWVLRDRY